MSRYFEIIITGRQLAALVVGVAFLVLVAFGLGVGVRLVQPSPEPVREMIVVAPPATPVPTQPTVVDVETVAEPTLVPSVTPLPVVTPVRAAAEATRPKTQPTVPIETVAPRKANRWVQVGAFARHDQADGVRNRVIALGFTPKQAVVQPVRGERYRVRVGPFLDGESAGRVASRLRAEGFGGAFVVKPGE